MLGGLCGRYEHHEWVSVLGHWHWVDPSPTHAPCPSLERRRWNKPLKASWHSCWLHTLLELSLLSCFTFDYWSLNCNGRWLDLRRADGAYLCKRQCRAPLRKLGGHWIWLAAKVVGSELQWRGEEWANTCQQTLRGRTSAHNFPATFASDPQVVALSLMLCLEVTSWSQLCPCLAKWTLEHMGHASVKVSSFLGVFCYPGCV